ncbi:hypothetical protein ASC95_17980 [Pelomonas sp. Root1217]|uniref:YfiR family protein n=1 Tax=Pelomonas sp. Root1217 TaxID=1736430 RepID=UPI00070FA006|nr:YfiR family protein [Pelomonas sp. Root1217]KQV49484.1 hypothetical protein ASC95_17980 [Pelomonas sp. Root1217]
MHAAFGCLRQGCAVLLLCCVCLGAPAQNIKATSADLKAVYLLKLPSFVEWPASAAQEATFVIVVVEADDVLHALEELSRSAKIMGRPVRVLRGSKDEAVGAAQLVFFGAAVRGLPAAVGRVRTDGTLIVSEQPSGLAEGAALRFVESGGRIRFEAAPDNAARHGVKLSARLLAVAARVEGASAP